MALFVFLHDRTQRVVPVIAESEAEARALIERELNGEDIGDQPIYRGDVNSGIDEIVAHIANQLERNGRARRKQ